MHNKIVDIFHNKMDATGDHYALLNKPVLKRQIHAFSDLW